MTTQPVVSFHFARAATDVIDDLASELDLHYDDDELEGTVPSLEIMGTLTAMLVEAGYPIPAVYAHILGRYHNSRPCAFM